jgi:hypothetical protein
MTPLLVEDARADQDPLDSRSPANDSEDRGASREVHWCPLGVRYQRASIPSYSLPSVIARVLGCHLGCHGPTALRLTDRCGPFRTSDLNSLSATECRPVSPFAAGVAVRNAFWLTAIAHPQKGPEHHVGTARSSVGRSAGNERVALYI